jgi:hypothetical protein
MYTCVMIHTEDGEVKEVRVEDWKWAVEYALNKIESNRE